MIPGDYLTKMVKIMTIMCNVLKVDTGYFEESETKI